MLGILLGGFELGKGRTTPSAIGASLLDASTQCDPRSTESEPIVWLTEAASWLALMELLAVGNIRSSSVSRSSALAVLILVVPR